MSLNTDYCLRSGPFNERGVFGNYIFNIYIYIYIYIDTHSNAGNRVKFFRVMLLIMQSKYPSNPLTVPEGDARTAARERYSALMAVVGKERLVTASEVRSWPVLVMSRLALCYSIRY